MDELLFEVPNRRAVRRAGQTLRDKGPASELENAYLVLSQWRACHAYVLNNCQAAIRRKTGSFKNALVAQRLKRMPSIIEKLQRFPEMAADRMADLGGIRVILGTVDEVYRFHSLISGMRSKHILQGEPKDYIETPKPDGYRSLHQILSYQNAAHPELNGLKVELQIRTKLQHSWATAVETMGTVRKASYKTGQGDEPHKEFFRLVGALFSWHETQKLPAYCEQMELREIADKLHKLDIQLNVFNTLASLAVTAKYIENSDKNFKGYHVLELDTQKKSINLTPFRQDQLEQAESQYKIRELVTRDNPAISIVLVAAGDLRQIKKTYPNYFLDTNAFLEQLKRILSGITGD